MAKRAGQPIPLLRPPAVYWLCAYIGVQVLALISLNLIFDRLQAVQSRSAATIIGSMLRNESLMSQSYLLAQSIEDMRTSKAIDCASLEVVNARGPINFYDSTRGGECESAVFDEVSLNGLDGNVWKVRVSPHVDASFVFVKWVTFFSVFVLISALFGLIHSFFRRENQKQRSIEQRRMFLENLNNQVRHDVASPLTALRMIAQHAPLNGETKIFLQQAVDRTLQIFESLKEDPFNSVAFDISNEIVSIVNEKKLSRADCVETALEIFPINLRVRKSDFHRMLSNLIDNSFDAGPSKVVIRARIQDSCLHLEIFDDGCPIPAKVASDLGKRGNTSGKVNGSGLGLAHAWQFMTSFGGDLRISNREGEKIILIFPPGVVQKS